jgi:Spy/CpxP family protein refolding chaperone
MKKLIIVLVLPLYINVASAQIRRTPTPSNPADSMQMNSGNNQQKESRKEMFDELNLTKDQRAQIKQIQQSRKAERDAISNSDSLSADQKQMKLKEFRKETEQSINAILTDDQRMKWKQMKQEMHENKMNSSNRPMMDSSRNNMPPQSSMPPQQ